MNFRQVWSPNLGHITQTNPVTFGAGRIHLLVAGRHGSHRMRPGRVKLKWPAVENFQRSATFLVTSETLRQFFFLQRAQDRGCIGKGLPLVLSIGVR